MPFMSALPEGVLTLFFSDFEGSTRLAKSHGDVAWAELLETHRALLRQAFAAHGGLEVDTQGDSFFAVFRMASDAVAAALAAQRSLAAQAWPAAGAVRVRIGLHTGEAIARGDHYVGQEIHRASRICDAGHGGQIVVSQTTAELVRGSLPEGATLVPLGDCRLKDLGQPQRLFQLGATGLASDFPVLRSLDVPTHLPTERSSFIGREADIIGIRERLAEHRLVTLTGIGGSGKTRLALQVGALELGNFADGVFFVDLAPVSDAELLASTVASACGLMLGDASGAGVASFEDRLIAALARRKSLVIVDNCEHMVEAVADLLDRILADCDKMTLLATSREALAVEGEQVVPVSSLAVPDDAALTQAQAEANDAVRLFIERAKAVKPGFALGPDNRAAVVEICRRLDGIPLAIEFAAARVAHLSVPQIAERLQDRFRLLTGGRRRIQRQQTLSVALAGLAATLHVVGRHDDALRAASRFMALPGQRDTTLAMTSILAVEVAPVLVAGGQHEAANRLLRDAMRDARRFGVLMADGQALSMIGIAEHLRGRSQRAGRLLAASRQVKGAEMHNGFRSPTSALLYYYYLPQVRAALGPDEARRARAEGQAMTLDEALA